MIKKENGSTTNKKHRAKKIIKLIIYIVLLGLLAFISVKSCNLTLKALTPPAASWDDLNNVNIICNVNGNLSNELDSNEYYYLNNGNNTSGLAQTPAFQIYDTYNGLAYDEIRIRQTDIKLRGYLYDSQDNYTDYYERTIWANDYIFENITPDTIRFENLSSDTPSNIVGATVYYPNALNPFSAFLNIINLSFIYSDLETETIYYTYWDNLTDGYSRNILLKTNYRENILYNFEINFSFNGEYQYSDYLYIGELLTITTFQSPLDIFFDVSYNTSTQDYDISITLSFNNNSYSDTFIYSIDGTEYSLSAEYLETSIYLSNSYYLNYITEQQYNIGYGAGYRLGRETGESVGYQDGYQDGYDDGASNTLNTSWVLSLMNTATSILNIEIFPGFKLIYLVGAFIILMFVRFVIGWVR